MEDLKFKFIKMKDIDIRFKSIDEFLELYGWVVYKRESRNEFILYDLQCDEIVDYYNYLYSLITRICGRALDYYSEEYDWEFANMHISDFNYISNLLVLYQMYDVNNKDKEWLNAKIEWLKNMKVYGKGDILK